MQPGAWRGSISGRASASYASDLEFQGNGSPDALWKQVEGRLQSLPVPSPLSTAELARLLEQPVSAPPSATQDEARGDIKTSCLAGAAASAAADHIPGARTTSGTRRYAHWRAFPGGAGDAPYRPSRGSAVF